jgi:hypothetical protein
MVPVYLIHQFEDYAFDATGQRYGFPRAQCGYDGSRRPQVRPQQLRQRPLEPNAANPLTCRFITQPTV